jgi:hypothetical protein
MTDCHSFGIGINLSRTTPEKAFLSLASIKKPPSYTFLENYEATCYVFFVSGFSLLGKECPKNPYHGLQNMPPIKCPGW